MEPTAKVTIRHAVPGNAIKRSDLVNNTFRITVPESIPSEALLERDCWRLLASYFLPFDKLECVSETGDWYCEYIVADCDRRKEGDLGTWAIVKPIFPVVHLGAEVPTDVVAPEGYTAKWRGPILRWCVIRDVDQKVLFEKCADKNTALDSINKLIKKAA